MENKTCKSCGFAELDTYRFCPNCGKKVNETLPLNITSQLGIYALSLILPPLGLWPAIKYLKNPDSKAKRIGIIAVILTIISIVLTLWFSIGIFNLVLGGFGVGNGQLESLQNLGY